MLVKYRARIPGTLSSEQVGGPLDALTPLGTDPRKPFLETAPYLIAVFAQTYGFLPDGRRVKHYYATESVGIATGLLITAIHHAGLVSLTHTPSPMGFLNKILDRPSHERPFLVVVVGFPATGATVPSLNKETAGGDRDVPLSRARPLSSGTAR